MSGEAALADGGLPVAAGKKTTPSLHRARSVSLSGLKGDTWGEEKKTKPVPGESGRSLYIYI